MRHCKQGLERKFVDRESYFVNVWTRAELVPPTEATQEGRSETAKRKPIFRNPMDSLTLDIVLIRERNVSNHVHFILHLADMGLVELDLWWCEGGGLDKVEGGVADELAGDPQERLLEVVVTLGAEFIVLERLFPVESD